MSRLGSKLLAIHDALDEARLRHAFGGAIALAYCTLEPRGTRDLDINVFAPPGQADDVLTRMPDGITYTDGDVAAIERDGQARVWWGETPIDLFFDEHDFHAEAAATVREVPFEGRTIPILGCLALLVFKAMFNRTRDWADIEAMLEAESVDGHEALETVRRLVGAEDPSTNRLAALVG